MAQLDEDSVKMQLRTVKSDTEKINIYNDLFLEYEFTDTVKAKKYLALALELSVEIDFKRGLAKTYTFYGFFHDDVGNYDLALESYDKSLKIRSEIGDVRGVSVTYNNMGIIYKELGNYLKAMECYHKSLKIKEEISQTNPSEKNAQGIMRTYNNMGIIYDEQKNFDQALKYYNLSLTMAEELDQQISIATAYNNLGVIAVKQDQHSKATEYFFKALKIYEGQGQGVESMNTYSNLALAFYHSAKKLNGLNSKTKAVDSLCTKALVYNHKSLVLREQFGDREGMAASYINIGNVHMFLNQADEALKYLNYGLELSKEISALLREEEAYKGLIDVYAYQNKYEQAYAHQQLFAEAKDSLFNEEKSKELGKLEATHEFEMQEMEKKRIAEEQTKKAANEKSRSDMLQYSGILIFLVLMAAAGFVLTAGKNLIPGVVVPIRLIEGVIFFVFLLFFEFTLVLLDPYIETYSSGAPAIKLGFNAILAAMIFPLHSFFEEKLKTSLINKQSAK